MPPYLSPVGAGAVGATVVAVGFTEVGGAVVAVVFGAEVVIAGVLSQATSIRLNKATKLKRINIVFFTYYHLPAYWTF